MRRTRIVATIGPACDDYETLKSLLEAGVDVCRFNYSHGEPEDKTDLYHRLRSIEDELGRPTCILADLPGPKLRLGNFPGADLLEEGAEILLHCGVTHLEATNGTGSPGAVIASAWSPMVPVWLPVCPRGSLCRVKRVVFAAACGVDSSGGTPPFTS